MTFCPQKTRKIKIVGRGVVRDESLHRWEILGWHSKHFFLLCRVSWNPFLIFWLQKQSKIKFMGLEVLRDEFLHIWELSTFHSLQLSIWSCGLKKSSHRSKSFLTFFKNTARNEQTFFSLEYSTSAEYSMTLKNFLYR